jgi:hypothetical protein
MIVISFSQFFRFLCLCRIKFISEIVRVLQFYSTVITIFFYNLKFTFLASRILAILQNESRGNFENLCLHIFSLK